MIAKFITLFIAAGLLAQVPQNPSPMKDSTRAHERLERKPVAGTRQRLPVGELLLPSESPKRGAVPLVVHFHGAAWIAEQSVRDWNRRAAVLTVELGTGSSVYSKPFQPTASFSNLLREAEAAVGRSLRPVVLTAYSAGYGAVREILRHHAGAVDSVILVDGLHASYDPEGRPGPLAAKTLDPFVSFAREAMAGRKQMLITHSEIFPGTFASTTETADYLIEQLGLRRKAVMRWGPLGMQQLSEAGAKGLLIQGFAGNSAPDHVDHLHAFGQWLRRLR